MKCNFQYLRHTYRCAHFVDLTEGNLLTQTFFLVFPARSFKDGETYMFRIGKLLT